MGYLIFLACFVTGIYTYYSKEYNMSGRTYLYISMITNMLITFFLIAFVSIVYNAIKTLFQ